MRNCIILGAGRSGTSMVAGTLARAGYYMGDTLLPPTEGNPKGYFESREVEAVNDALVRTMLRPTRHERWLAWLNPPPQQPDFDTLAPWSRARWLAQIPPHRKPYVKPIYQAEIARLTSHAPFCFKDPRFSYTLPAWRPFLSDTVFVCVFREPALTVASILKELRTEPYLHGLSMTPAQVFQTWIYSYRHVLENHRHEGEWLFLHYEQAITRDGLAHLELCLKLQVDADFPDPSLQRTRSELAVPPAAQRIYGQLCQLAGYSHHA